MKETAVLWVMNKLSTLNGLKELDGINGKEYYHRLKEIEQKGLTMEKEQSENYAEFAVECDRRDMPILEFHDYIQLKKK
jgi:hypothetical protein